jgi:hypothetical protein
MTGHRDGLAGSMGWPPRSAALAFAHASAIARSAVTENLLSSTPAVPAALRRARPNLHNGSRNSRTRSAASRYSMLRPPRRSSSKLRHLVASRACPRCSNQKSASAEMIPARAAAARSSRSAASTNDRCSEQILKTPLQCLLVDNFPAELLLLKITPNWPPPQPQLCCNVRRSK